MTTPRKPNASSLKNTIEYNYGYSDMIGTSGFAGRNMNDVDGGLNLNVNDYTVKELLDLLKITEDQKTLSEYQVSDAVDSWISKYKSAIGKQNEDMYEDAYILFYRRIQHKLHEYVRIFIGTPANVNAAVYQQIYNHDKMYNTSELHAAAGEQHLIKQRPAPVQNTYNYEYPQGTINPVEKRVMKKVVNIDTLFRRKYELTESTNFLWVLPMPINNVISMKIVSTEIPNMSYSFSNRKQNNQCMIYLYNVNDGTGNMYDTSHNVVIPEGNYMADEFNVVMNNFFHNSGNGLNFLVSGVNTYTSRTYIRARSVYDLDDGSPMPFDPSGVYYSPNFFFVVDFNLSDDPSVSTPPPPPDPLSLACRNNAWQRTHTTMSKINYNNGKVNPYDIGQSTLKLRPLWKNLGWMMGFRKDIYLVDSSNVVHDKTVNTNETVHYNCYLSSESSYGSSVNQYFFIEVDDFNSNFTSDAITSSTGNSYLGRNIMAKVPIVNGHFNMINANQSDHIYRQRDYFGPVNIEKLNIRLLDRYGEVIDLVNNDYSLAFEFTILY
jgi:hypothetical protein